MISNNWLESVKVDDLQKLIDKQTIVYGEEEKTLKVMMEMQQVKQPVNER